MNDKEAQTREGGDKDGGLFRRLKKKLFATKEHKREESSSQLTSILSDNNDAHDPELPTAMDEHEHYFASYVMTRPHPTKRAVMAEVMKDPEQLKFASREFRASKEVVMAAFVKRPIDNFMRNVGAQRQISRLDGTNQDWLARGLALEYASVALRDDDQVVMTAVQLNGYALRFASKRVRANKDIAHMAVRHDERAFAFVDDHLKADKDIVLAAVKQNPELLKSALGGLNQDRDCWIAAGLWKEEDGVAASHSNMISSTTPSTITGCHVEGAITGIRVALSTKFSLSVESTSTATSFTKLLTQHPYLGSTTKFRVFSPNAFSKGTCDPDWTSMDWPCRGTYETCRKDERLKTGTPVEECCWRYSFRWHLQAARDTKGFMIQVVDLEGDPKFYQRKVSNYEQGNGQKIETVMARDVGTKIFRIFRPRSVSAAGDVQILRDFQQDDIDRLAFQVQNWYQHHCKDMAECEIECETIID